MPKENSALHELDSLSSLKDKLGTMDRLGFPSPSSYCIYRVPPKLRKMNEAAYTPSMASIGPYHHGIERLKSMEEVKLKFLYKFLKRATQENLFDYYVGVLREQEDKIPRCYSETIPMGSNEFVRMILTDACFIIKYCLVWLDRDVWYSKLWSWEASIDLILLENQLPFFVLKHLFDLALPNADISFERVIFHCFSIAFLGNIVPNEKLQEKFTFTYFEQHHLPRLPNGTLQVHHLCDMLRIFYVRRLDDQPREDNFGWDLKPVYGVSKLHDAEIKIKLNEYETSLFKLKYSNGVLEIPKIIVDDHTETLIRNVVAFEQRHFPFPKSMTDYIILLELFVRTGKDVEVLEEKGIIQNFFGENDAVAYITKRLGRYTNYGCFSNAYLSKMFEDLNEFCDSPYHRYKAIFKEQYWSTPWRIVSLLGALLLLFLTLIQTISSVIALFQN